MNATHDNAFPGHDELVARAVALQPALAERAAKANEQRRLSAETIADFQKAGFFKLLQPTRWGGWAAHPNTFFEVCATLSSVCPSSAWVLGVVGVHNWQLALFDERAQDEVWADHASVLISSSYMPVGKVTRVEGGFRLSGRWGFSSGSDHCDWAFLGAFVPPPEGETGPPDMRTFLVPKRDYVLDDDWHVMGLRGTGSKSVVVEDAFVPEYRTHRFSDGFKQDSPGNEKNDEPLYRLPFGQIFVRSVSTGSLGMARGALRAYLEVQAGRVARGDGQKVAGDPRVQEVAARAAATIDEAELVLRRNFDEMMGYVERGEKIPLDKRLAYRFSSSRMVDRLVETVDELFTASGGAAIFQTHPIQRYFLDIHTSRAHYANNPDKPGRNQGGVMLGLRNTDFFI